MPRAFESLDDLPTGYEPGAALAAIQSAIAASGRKVLALDDDPTGVQTVHDVRVLTRWSEESIAHELADARPITFVLTNSRSLTAAAASAINREIALQAIAAARRVGIEVALLSRSDSTLRGHVFEESNALAEACGAVDGLIVCPAFFEGGRVTVDDVHYIRERDRLIPVSETEFARDPTFGYRSSNLREWLEERSDGRIRARDVASLSLDEIRSGDVARISHHFQSLGGGRALIVNAVTYADLEVAMAGLLDAEARGRRFVYRTGASFARVRAGQAAQPLLDREQVLGPGAAPWMPGLVVVGSHVQKSSEQLLELLELPRTRLIELDVQRLLGGGDRRVQIVAQAIAAAHRALAEGRTPVIATSRTVIAPGGEAQLEISRSVSAGLVEVVRGIEVDPGFVLGKGGITSSDIGTEALGARRPLVIGQIHPGVPVWRLDEDSLRPGMPYVIFPGNVGTRDTLARVVDALRGRPPA